MQKAGTVRSEQHWEGREREGEGYSVFTEYEVQFTESLFSLECALYPARNALSGRVGFCRGGQVGWCKYVGLHRSLPPWYDDLPLTYQMTTLHLPNDHSQITNYLLKFTEWSLRIYRMNVDDLDIWERDFLLPTPSLEPSLAESTSGLAVEVDTNLIQHC